MNFWGYIKTAPFLKCKIKKGAGIFSENKRFESCQCLKSSIGDPFVSELKFWAKTEKEQSDADKAASDLNCSCYMGGRNTLNRLSTVRNFWKKGGPGAHGSRSLTGG